MDKQAGVFVFLPDRHLSLLSRARHTERSWLTQVGLVPGSELNFSQSGAHIYTWLGPPSSTEPLAVSQEDAPLIG